MVERYVRDVEVAGSNPVTPIKINLKAYCFEIFFGYGIRRKLPVASSVAYGDGKNASHTCMIYNCNFLTSVGGASIINCVKTVTIQYSYSR